LPTSPRYYRHPVPTREGLTDQGLGHLEGVEEFTSPQHPSLLTQGIENLILPCHRAGVNEGSASPRYGIAAFEEGDRFFLTYLPGYLYEPSPFGYLLYVENDSLGGFIFAQILNVFGKVYIGLVPHADEFGEGVALSNDQGHGDTGDGGALADEGDPLGQQYRHSEG